VFKYLENADIDEVGYTLRTASLMTDPEYYFNEKNPGDYALFGIRYLILPANHPPAVPALLVVSSGPYRLYLLPNNGYVRVADIVGTLVADRSNVGLRSVAYLNSPLPRVGKYLTVAFDGRPAPTPTGAGRSFATPPGQIISSRSQLTSGIVRATIVTRRRAVAVLSASYDPGWTVTVNGLPARTVMVAPALVAVQLNPGTYHVVFQYVGFAFYPELLAAALLVLLSWILATLCYRNSRRRDGKGPVGGCQADNIDHSPGDSLLTLGSSEVPVSKDLEAGGRP